MRKRPIAGVAGVLLLSTTLGCQAIAERFGDKDDDKDGDKPTPETVVVASADEESKGTGGAETDADRGEKKKRRRKKKGRRTKKPQADAPKVAPPEPALELDATLERAIVPGKNDGSTRVDPFVLTMLIETLERDGGRPFTRTTKAQRKAGTPAGLKVEGLANDSLWHELGLRDGDYVLAVGDARPPGPKHARALLESLPLAPAITVELQRNGKEKTLEFEIVPGLAWRTYLEEEASRTFPKAKSAPASRSSGGGSSNAKPSKGSKPAPTATPIRVTCSGSTCSIPKSDFDRLVGSSSQTKKEARGKSMGLGYQLTFVGPGARKAGFRVGDVIREVNGKSTKNTLQMLSLYGGLKSTRKFRVVSSRGNTKRTTTILVK